jgi:hypothetical protein
MARSRTLNKPIGTKPIGRKALGQRSLVWIEGTACGVLAAVATPMFLLLAGLLLPGLMALVLDQTPRKKISKAMLLMGFAASAVPARDLWVAGIAMPNSMQLLTDPVTLGLAWGAGFCGWAISEVAPIVVSLVIEARTITRVTVLQNLRDKLEEEWGLPPPEGEDESAL